MVLIRICTRKFSGNPPFWNPGSAYDCWQEGTLLLPSHLSCVLVDAVEAILVHPKPSLLHLVPRNHGENVALHWHGHLKEDPPHGGQLLEGLHHLIDAFLGFPAE